ncbi:PREDICTED: uncharacterized protein LOC109581518 [Amphimedon queenslandica]|uniref:HMG box domain-containing protein n=1 Tax=Amphimedon queenslandica TaxID=400682 RepID=A0A1X7V126_AMPQE|nr:PREDICTED: uncharacterized protein LOC109581518 [Amphimedon queenslandica]|eukprot:XP_019851255.1 PREDICTED: uncharacterized protein LOC109581518 [Amphimedon queenslandica]
MAQSSPVTSVSRKGKFSAFTVEQRATLLKYFDEYGMTSTHRRNIDLITQCAAELGTTIPKVKNWIGSEVVKRKRKVGILPLPKFEFSSGSPELKPSTAPAKKIRRVNGYNLFFSEYVQNHPDLGPDFKERNTIVATRWGELSEEERKQWATRAEAVCSTSIQEYNQQQQLVLQDSSSPVLSVEENLVEKTLLQIQDKFELLEQLGFEGYAIFVNTGALQTHLLATNKGKAYHKQRQQLGKPLENPFIGYVFSDNVSELIPSSTGIQVPSPVKVLKPTTLLPATGPVTAVISPVVSNSNVSLNVETMQRSVANAFALKYKICTGRSDLAYDNLEESGVQVYGLPEGVPFHSPILYSQQQLQQILANQDKIVFLKIPNSEAGISEVEIEPESVATLVHEHSIHLTPNPAADA